MNVRTSEAATAALPFSSNIIGGASVGAADGRASMSFAHRTAEPSARSRAAARRMSTAPSRRRDSAFEGDWGRLTATERGRLLIKLGQAIADNAAELAALESRDTGKPLKQGEADMVAAARYFEFYGAAADKLHGDTLPFLNGYTVAIVRDPHGVTGHIIPWNYPAQIFGRSVGASLACGNACVVKPAEDACLSVIRFAELARDVGFPDGALNIVAGLGARGGRGAVRRIPASISFRSPELAATGAAIQAAAARNNIGVHDGARRQVAATPVRRRRYRGGGAGHHQCDHPERRPDLFGRLARSDRALGLCGLRRRRSPSVSPRCAPARMTAISTWAR